MAPSSLSLPFWALVNYAVYIIITQARLFWLEMKANYTVRVLSMNFVDNFLVKKCSILPQN
jgi:hypothetical protein